MQTIEQAFQEVCRLHEQIAQTPPPEIGPQVFLPFPPGVDPIAFAIEEVAQLRQLVENAQSTRSQTPQPTTATWVPRASVFASDGGLMFHVEIPGVAKEDVSVVVESGELVVRGERRAPAVDPSLRPVMVEQAWGNFERRFAAPPWFNPEKIQARYSHGMLEIRMNRVEDRNVGEFRVEIA